MPPPAVQKNSAVVVSACASWQPPASEEFYSGPELTAAYAAQFAELALGCVHREYPNKISHVMQSDEDAQPPRELTPAFYGCFDWHSSTKTNLQK